MTSEEQKRRKIAQAPSMAMRLVSSPAAKKTRDKTSTSSLMVAEPHTSSLYLRIQQARNFAVAQAQQEGCMGNYKIFDSPYGNFLVPVIPSREELAGGSSS
ncbi:hypothetical protein HS088_TW09G01068 [Tripterygium wilfordii]|uniref:Uncharacterized protein n=1 Tax=Tripterygium wilfordii TaxID=458696 RepID=A0A7J7DAA0_TRIWF|nr:uncharacterized protein LOC120005882 [Tripterygium wilfordii]KAF5743006.1 hypothetical protein HS088_TW09G01068 [Tripterygium wilfordii]